MIASSAMGRRCAALARRAPSGSSAAWIGPASPRRRSATGARRGSISRRRGGARGHGARIRPVNVVDQIGKVWSDFLALLSKLIIPDWAGLIALLPVLVLIGIVGPLLTIGVLAWLGYGITRPRTKVTYQEGAHVAERDHLGRPIIPAGEPYCPRDGLIYASGTNRCDVDNTRLLLRCPKCDVVREAAIATCPQCGLSMKLAHREMVVATDRPPPGGAAVA